VPERDAVVLVHEHPGVQPCAQRNRWDTQPLQHGVGRAPARGGQHSQHPRVEPGGARQHRFLQRRRARREQLLDEERVAAGPRVHVVHDGGGDRSALEPFDQPRRLRPVQRVELDPGHVRAPREFGGEPAQGVRQFVVDAVGGQHDDPLVPQIAGQEGQQRERRGIGPVQVLEHEQRGRRLPQPLEHELVELPASARRQRAEVPERGDERPERELRTTELDALAVQQREVGGGRLDRLHEARLADPGLPGDQPQRRTAGFGVGQRALQTSERHFAPDHRASISDRG
jgi:hypothetical protein